MALTPSQKLAIKRHLGQQPNSSIVDPLVSTLEDGAAYEAELVDVLTECDTARAAITTAQSEADELTEGEGAKFNHHSRIAIKRQRYREAVENLARLIGWPLQPAGAITGFFRA